MEFGEALRIIRKNKGMKLKEAAGEVISVSHLSRVEEGKTNFLQKSFLRS